MCISNRTYWKTSPSQADKGQSDYKGQAPG